MASEKDRWFCLKCKAFMPNPGSVETNPTQNCSVCGDWLRFIPAAALDAHTAEVVERCLEIVGRHLAGYIATHPAFGIVGLVDEIRALAPRKDSARPRASAEEEKT